MSIGHVEKTTNAEAEIKLPNNFKEKLKESFIQKRLPLEDSVKPQKEESRPHQSRDLEPRCG
jgi:hypothetical protein